MAKGLHAMENELANAEARAHLMELPNVKKKRANKSGKLRPGVSKASKVTTKKSKTDNEEDEVVEVSLKRKASHVNVVNTRQPKRRKVLLDNLSEESSSDSSEESSSEDSEDSEAVDDENSQNDEENEGISMDEEDDPKIDEENNNIPTTCVFTGKKAPRPQIQVGARVKVHPSYVCHAGEHWPGLAIETSKGWQLNNIHGIIRRDTGSGRRSIWQVQWFGRHVLPRLYEIDNSKTIYVLHEHEYNEKVEDRFPRIVK